MDDQTSGNGYEKRPLWQWILLYVIIGGIVYGLVYYFVFRGHGNGYNYKVNAPHTAPAQNQQPTQTGEHQNPTNSTNTATSYLDIYNYVFNGDVIAIDSIGATETWINHDNVPHQVVSDTGVFKSPILKPGDTYSFTFKSAGTYTYHCAIHSYMNGTMIIK